MEGIDEVAPPSATGEDFPMEKKQWVLGQHRTRNLVIVPKLDTNNCSNANNGIKGTIKGISLRISR
ncbi:hypothetical protein F2Q69_00054272 [Brassica cretica]|uniref:Uncharacterized protein n=1 Tax=Brassica cretica TaxID=69181 RepID=A0A8S9MX70_BRACR|nr:hypothetical protein F2Q69_00054272 [Brassica cretica]